MAIGGVSICLEFALNLLSICSELSMHRKVLRKLRRRETAVEIKAACAPLCSSAANSGEDQRQDDEWKGGNGWMDGEIESSEAQMATVLQGGAATSRDIILQPRRVLPNPANSQPTFPLP